MKQEKKITYVPRLKVYPTYSVIYTRPCIEYTNKEGVTEFIQLPRKTNENSIRQLTKQQDKAMLSAKVKAKIRNTINWLLFLSKEKTIQIDNNNVKSRLSFITLTLPSTQKHDDKIIVSKCLNQLLTELKQAHGMTMYLWKAETQANGNIHFHLTSNVVIHYEVLQNIWNRIIEKLGYIADYRKNQNDIHKNGFRYNADLYKKYGITAEVQNARYKKGIKENWSNPHSTEIKNVQKVSNLAAYISEYICKNPDKERRPVTCRVWSSSQNLSSINLTLELLESEISFSGYKIIETEAASIVCIHVSQLLNTDLKCQIVSYFKNLIPTALDELQL